MSTYEISKSSLLSLKAEILRKQEELNKSKLQNKAKKAQSKKLTLLEVKNKGIEQREVNDISEEDENLLRKSRSVLETKAKLYEKLSKQKDFTDDELEHNQRFLVRFDKKASVHNNLPPEELDNEGDVNKYPESDEEQYLSDEYEPAKNPEEEWVEYTDCLGRTRKCMRKDLEFLKSKDADFRASIDRNENKVEQMSKPESEKQEKDKDDNSEITEDFTENSELLSSDMRRELLRQQWEKEENELRKKDDIHYQDILFNEARTHGVGYYAFSKDEEERSRQQEALKNLRQETAQEQKRAQELRNLREKQLASRSKAARNRKRARMGLPPEEDEPETVQEPPKETPCNEEEEKKKAEEEKEQQRKDAARKKHIRPWDIGKEGIREHYEYTQEEWVTKKRKERPEEFAPPSSYRRSFRGDHKTDDKDSEIDKTLFFSTKKNKTSSKKQNNLKNNYDEPEILTDTSKPPPNIVNPYKVQESYDYKQKNSIPFEPTPIINECEDFDEEQDRLLQDYMSHKGNSNETLTNSLYDSSSDEGERGKGTEVAPPATFDYYGPSGTKKRKPNSGGKNIEDSITAGLKFLRQQAEKKNTSTKHPSEMFLL